LVLTVLAFAVDGFYGHFALRSWSGCRGADYEEKDGDEKDEGGE
jgi:hypothetical protein